MNLYFFSTLALLGFCFLGFPLSAGWPHSERNDIEVKSEAESVLAPPFLYKVVSLSQWRESLRQYRVLPCPLDQSSGFVHLAKEDQLSSVVSKFWNGVEHVVLKVETQKLKGRLVCETNPGGTHRYFHLYDGEIPLDAVVETTVVQLPRS